MLMKTLNIKIYLSMSNKSTKAGNWLKAIAAVISFIAGLITGGNTSVVDNITNFIQ